MKTTTLPKGTQLYGTCVIEVIVRGRNRRVPISIHGELVGKKTVKIVEPAINPDDFADMDEYHKAYFSMVERRIPIDRFWNICPVYSE